MYESKNGYQSPIVEFDWDQVVLYGCFEKLKTANNCVIENKQSI